MCTGRVDLSFVIRSFAKGADGVIIGGCWLGECHYVTEGNYDALANMHLGRRMLEHIGVKPERLRIEWIAASEGARFAEVMTDFTQEIKDLGPIGEVEGLDAAALREGLDSVGKMVPQLKILSREKLQVKVKSEEAYTKLFENEKTHQLLDAFLADPASLAEELPAYYIDPELCVGCGICLRKCPIQGIEGGKKTVHVIDQDMCTHCGTCFHACPPRIGAVSRITDGDIPDPPPEDQRAIAKPPKKQPSERS